MSRIDWEFLFKRRKWSLKNYLSDCTTVKDAVNKFQSSGIRPPSEEILIEHGMKSESASPGASSASLPKPKPAQPLLSKKAKKVKDGVTKEKAHNEKSEKYDDILILET